MKRIADKDFRFQIDKRVQQNNQLNKVNQQNRPVFYVSCVGPKNKWIETTNEWIAVAHITTNKVQIF